MSRIPKQLIHIHELNNVIRRVRIAVLLPKARNWFGVGTASQTVSHFDMKRIREREKKMEITLFD